MIVGVEGLNGAGKSALAVIRAALAAKKLGVPLVSNLALHGARQIQSWEDLYELRNCVVVLDEVLAVANSRDASALPTRAALWLTTLRHSQIGLFYTTVSLARADIILREVTTGIVSCYPLWPARRQPGDVWPRRRRTWVIDSSPRLDDQGELQRGMGFPVLTDLRPAFALYDSFADVSVLDRTRFPRMCPDCGASIVYGRHEPGFVHEHVHGAGGLEAPSAPVPAGRGRHAA